MTREEAVSILRRYRRDYICCFNDNEFLLVPKRNIHFKKSVYGKVLIDELIRKIKATNTDPIEVVSIFYTDLDYVLGDSDDDHFETHTFASWMECLAWDVLDHLRTIEKERCEE